MSSHCNSPSASTEIRGETKIKTQDVTYMWTITNFSFHQAIGNNLNSAIFASILDNEIKWYLSLEFDNDSNNIAFYVHLSKDSNYEEVFAKFIVSFLDQAHQNTLYSHSMINVHKHTTKPNLKTEFPGWGWKPFKKVDADFKKKFLINDTLTIKCVITYSTPDAVGNALNKFNDTRLYPAIPEWNPSQCFGLLLETHYLADVVLSIKGQEYLAHKVILAAHSSVFAAMFRHNAKEKEENRVDIDDMDAEVVSEMLRYIYTGKCEKLPELATGLLAAADKYDLDRLKMVCAEELYKTLSVENAATVLALADMHGVEELKNKAIKFIVSKPTQVFSSEGWKNVRSNFALADEVCLAIARRCESSTTG